MSSQPPQLETARPRAASAVPAIDIRNVHMAFEQPAGLLHVLEDVSLSVKQGEFVAILGPSGCGKSTLLRLVAESFSRQAAGSSVLAHPAEARRGSRARVRVPQPVLLRGSGAANVSLPLRSGAGDEAQAAGPPNAAQAVGLDGLTWPAPGALGRYSARVSSPVAWSAIPILLMD